MTGFEVECLKRLLLSCGIYPSRKGFEYIVSAVMFFKGCECKICNVYDKIAKQYGVRVANVERCIRHSILDAGERGTLEKLNEAAGVKIVSANDYLSNSDFIGILSAIVEFAAARQKQEQSFDEQGPHPVTA